MTITELSLVSQLIAKDALQKSGVHTEDAPLAIRYRTCSGPWTSFFVAAVSVAILAGVR